MSDKMKKPKSITKVCSRCNKESVHRLSVNYYACSVCTENASIKHRKKYWYRYLAQKANARKREGSVRLTEADVRNAAERTGYRCAITGVILDVNSEWYKPSLDRIDNSKGYSPSNIRIVAWIVNYCRGHLTDLEFMNMCVQVANHNSYSPYLLLQDPL
jgi:ribosomal protein L37AE/L43A